MASKSQIKDYVANAFYHLYNRGVGKMDIFRREEDFAAFLHYLRIIFSPVEVLEQELSALVDTKDSGFPKASLQLKRLALAIHQSHRLQLYRQVELLSFSLMPNHFHLLVYQTVKNGIENLMRRLGVGYAGYFTRSYGHVGSVFQGAYKASHLYYEPEIQALVAARYIERNSFPLNNQSPVKTSRELLTYQGKPIYPFSSLQYYFHNETKGSNPPIWLNTKRLQEIFAQFKNHPNSVLEETVGKYGNFTDFVFGVDNLSLEDIRLMHLATLN